MDNIGDLLGSVLSDPESMAKLRETARQLGLDASGETPETNAAQIGVPIGVQKAVPDGVPGLAAAMTRLTPLLGKLSEEDDMTRLIHALMPYLSGTRLKRAEEAERIVSVMRVIPLLRQSGQE